MPDCELYNHHKSIFVAPDVKDIVLVAKIQHLYEICKKIQENLQIRIYLLLVVS